MSVSKFIALGVLLAAEAFGQTVTGITFKDVSHSDALVQFTTSSAAWNNARIRYAASPSTCTGGTGGNLQSWFGTNGLGGGIAPSTAGAIVVSGLSASTTYQVCVEISPDGGTTWTSGVGASLTTLTQLQYTDGTTGAVLTSTVHPIPPVAPATFDTTYPNTSTGYSTVSVASDCSDLNSKWDAAIDNQLTTGTILSIPAGSVCLGVDGSVSGGNAQFGPSHLAPDVTSNRIFGPASVTAGTGTINLPSHGLTEGQAIIFGTHYACLPGSSLNIGTCRGAGSPYYTLPIPRGPINLGSIYYAHVVDANNIQVYQNAPMGSSGTLLTYSNTGCVLSGSCVATGTTGMYLVEWPRPLHNIIIRTSAADSAFAPAGTSVAPYPYVFGAASPWASQMVTLVDPIAALTSGHTLLSPLGGDSNVDLMTANTRFVGLELTYQQTGYAATTSDPKAWLGLYVTNPTNSDVIFDRGWMHGLGTPSRVFTAIGWNGKDVAIIDSYMDNFEYFHSAYSGLVISSSSSHVASLTGGTANGGDGNVTIASGVTATISGSGTGEAFVYFDMTASNRFTVSTPASITASCAGGSTCASAVAGTGNGACNYTDGWPKDGDGNPTVIQIACINIVSGSISSVLNADAMFSRYNTEGCQCVTAGIGPGPWKLEDNVISGAGLIWHFDDAGQTWAIRGDYTLHRNLFYQSLTRMFAPTNTLSNGLAYFVRQPLEWKAGNRILIDGNIFDGAWAEDNPASVTISMGAYFGTTDVNLTNNTFRHVPGITEPVGVSTNGDIVAQPEPGNRYSFTNNLAWDVNGTTYCSPAVFYDTSNNRGGCTTAAKGWIFQGPGQTEDGVISHNTIVGNTGGAPTFMQAGGSNVEGWQIQNNFMYLDGSFYGVTPQGSQMSPACTSNGQAGLDCSLKPSYIWAGNVMIGNGVTQSQVQTAWPGHVSTNYIPSNTALSSVGWWNYAAGTGVNGNPLNLDFHLKANYCSGCTGSGVGPATDHLDVGADIDKLETAQGKVTLIGTPENLLMSTQASIYWVSGDPNNCLSIDYSSTDPTLVSSFTRTVPALPQPTVGNATISGLSSGTTYYYRLNCAVEQPTGIFKTRP